MPRFRYCTLPGTSEMSDMPAMMMQMFTAQQASLMRQQESFLEAFKSYSRSPGSASVDEGVRPSSYRAASPTRSHVGTNDTPDYQGNSDDNDSSPAESGPSLTEQIQELLQSNTDENNSDGIIEQLAQCFYQKEKSGPDVNGKLAAIVNTGLRSSVTESKITEVINVSLRIRPQVRCPRPVESDSGLWVACPGSRALCSDYLSQRVHFMTL